MPRNPLCVYPARDEEEAAIVAAWLNEEGIITRVEDDHGRDGEIVGLTTLASPSLEVCVEDEETYERAIDLLEEHSNLIDGGMSDSDGNVITAVCDNCHESATFPLDDAGTVQECPYCSEYLDVPEP